MVPQYVVAMGRVYTDRASSSIKTGAQRSVGSVHEIYVYFEAMRLRPDRGDDPNGMDSTGH